MAAVATPETRARSRRRRRMTLSRRFESAGPLTYLFLLGVAIFSFFPLYWSVVVSSRDQSAIGRYPPRPAVPSSRVRASVVPAGAAGCSDDDGGSPIDAAPADAAPEPLFPADYVNEVQIMSTVYSADKENDP